MPDARLGRAQRRVRGIPLATIGTAAVVLMATLITAPSESAEITAQASTKSSCSSARAALQGMDVDTSDVYSLGRVSLNGWTVAFRDSRWQAEHERIDLRTRAFHSAAWMIPDSPRDVGPAIDLFIEQSTDNPDPGSVQGSQALKVRGWIEGHVTWRLKIGLCLYRMAGAEDAKRLLPALEQLIQANLDPYRYYGPPVRTAHNHGLMADRELLNAARTLNREDLVRKALQRLSLQQAQMYGPCGFMFEQASGYQRLHASLWNQILKRIPEGSPSLGIQDTIERINSAADSLAFPDGTIAVIGDGKSRVVEDLSRVEESVRVMCPVTGWFSRRLVNDTLSQHVIARFGPATTMHGHADKGSLVWWVGQDQRGIPVVVDRGMGAKTRPRELADSRAVHSHAAFSWNDVANAESQAVVERMPGGMQRLRITGTPTTRGGWERLIITSKSRATITIKDRVRSSLPAGKAKSYLPLDPAWKKTSKAGVFVTAEGARLTVTCSTSAGGAIKMKTQQVADYQLKNARDALTVRCQVPDARTGITMKIKVSLT